EELTTEAQRKTRRQFSRQQSPRIFVFRIVFLSFSVPLWLILWWWRPHQAGKALGQLILGGRAPGELRRRLVPALGRERRRRHRAQRQHPQDAALHPQLERRGVLQFGHRQQARGHRGRPVGHQDRLFEDRRRAVH